MDRAFEQLVLTYQDRLYRFGLRLSGNTQDAEEIAQDAFVRAHGALSGYAADRIETLVLRPWLYQITLNVFRNRVRRRQLHVIPLDGHDQATDGAELIADSAANAEQADHVAALIAALPDRHRVALVLRHIEGLSYAEMATTLNQPVGTIKANVHRGIETLRTALKEETSEVKP